MRIRTDPGAPFLDQRPQPHPLQLAYAVGRQEHTCADLAELWRLLINRRFQAMRDQRPGGKQAANATANDRDPESPFRHRPLSGSLALYPHFACSSFAMTKRGSSAAAIPGIAMRETLRRSFVLAGRTAVALMLCLAASIGF